MRASYIFRRRSAVLLFSIIYICKKKGVLCLLLSFAILLSGCYGDPSAVTGPAEDEPAPEQFGWAIVQYRPAPGQFVNHSDYSNSTAALGPPDGRCVTLGGFGGSLTLRFTKPLRDRPGEPELVIWGNALYSGGDPAKKWMEPAVIEISSNGSDWILIGGSHFNTGNPPEPFFSHTYTNQQNNSWPAWCAGEERLTVAAPSLTAQVTNWYTNGTFDFSGAQQEQFYGYGDCTPAGVKPGSGLWVVDDPLSFGTDGVGGDVIFLEWAVDGAGNSCYEAQVKGRDFYYLRLTAAVLFSDPLLGENSPEIDAVGIIP